MAQRDRPVVTATTRRLTIEDVAVEAGVSVATVSRALRGLPNVTPSTRERVCAVAERLDYHPDPAASRLAAGRTQTITVAVPSVNGWYFSNVVAGAEAVVAEAGLEFQVVAVASPDQRERLLDESQRLERRTDGLIFVDLAIDPTQVASLERRDIAIAAVGTHIAGHPSVGIDDVEVGRVAATHLIDLGHKRIGVIGGHPDGPLSFDVPKARWRGFAERLDAAGLHVDDDNHGNGNFSMDGGFEAMHHLLRSSTPATAVFAMSDEMAFGALMALAEAGLTPGHDVSLLGVDDHEFARVVHLSTIHQSVADHGARAARLLLTTLQERVTGTHDAIAETGAPEPTRLPITLVERATTGPPAR
jgi:DNA-binding LacI/PurR family transcriptional regulator